MNLKRQCQELTKSVKDSEILIENLKHKFETEKETWKVDMKSLKEDIVQLKTESKSPLKRMQDLENLNDSVNKALHNSASRGNINIFEALFKIVQVTFLRKK